MPFRKKESKREPARLAVRLFTRSHCPLCDEAKEQLARVGVELGLELELEEVDVESDPELERRYGRRIPVLTCAGREVAEGRVDEAVLRAALLRGAR